MSTAASSGRRCPARPLLPLRRELRGCSPRSYTTIRHLNPGSKLGRNPAHRRATLRNLVTNLIERERITTTLTRARAARPIAERMITLGKKDTLQTRRQAAAFLMTPAATQKLFRDIAPRFSDRSGGYTRIVAAGLRVGDGAKVALPQLTRPAPEEEEKKGKRKKGIPEGKAEAKAGSQD